MNKKINEGLEMDMTTYKKVKGTLDPKTPIKITGDKPNVTMEENIEPQDQASIKYLSNVKDGNTGEISKPFTIADKRYQMVRGQHPINGVVMGVYCHDDMDANGENLIHSIEEFEKNIALPMKEQMALQGQDIAVAPKASQAPIEDSLKLSEYKHYVVNERTGKFRKFNKVSELANCGMSDDERYMGLKEFKKFFEGKVFGQKKKTLDEVDDPNDEQAMHGQAIKFINLFKAKIPTRNIEMIKKNPVAQREVIAAFAEIIGVPRTGLAKIIAGIKDLVMGKDAVSPTEPQAGITESKVMTKSELQESIKEKNVIKTVKIKDIRNGRL